MQAFADTLAQLKLGTAQTFENLTVFPLLGDQLDAADYLTLDEALERKVATVSEVSEGGIVPELRFDNVGDSPVLLVDGEELVGAKQNRVLNLSILAGAHSSVRIPVSCVERGRWRYMSRHFRSADRNLYASARAAKMAQVSASLRQSGLRCSDQFSVWEDIAAKSDRLNARSTTEAMASIYERHRSRLDAYQSAFQVQEAQVGATFAVNGSIVGLEVFDVSATFRKLLKKLVGSYALDAIDVPETRNDVPSLDEVIAFLDRVKRAALEFFPAVGEGQDVRLNGHSISGAALLAGGRLVHLSAFATVPEESDKR